jgi:DNA-binding CsgD family transcriptional regulator
VAIGSLQTCFIAVAPIENPVAPADVDLLKALSDDVVRALEAIGVPAYVVDCHRRVRWQNAASVELVGDLRGRLDGSVGLEAGDLKRVRTAWAEKLDGATHAQLEVSIPRPDGIRVRVAVNSVPLRDRDGEMIGSFGLVHVLEELVPPAAGAPSLSPRERQTLTLLAAGLSTGQMAQQMGLSPETVRNYVKRVLRSLGARSRVEAVAKGRQAGLI